MRLHKVFEYLEMHLAQRVLIRDRYLGLPGKGNRLAVISFYVFVEPFHTFKSIVKRKALKGTAKIEFGPLICE